MNSQKLWNILEDSKDADIFTIITMSIVYLVKDRGYKVETIFKLVKNGEYDFLDSYVDEKGLGKLYLDCWDGVFLDWNNVEIINFDGLEICETH